MIRRPTRSAALLAAVGLIGSSIAIVPLSSAVPAMPRSPSTGEPEVTGTVTLLTGDKVTLTAGSPPQVRPAVGREGVPYRISKERGVLSVLPVDAARAIAAGVLDPRLFEVTTLLRFGYDDSRRATVPLIVQRDPKTRSAEPPAGLKTGRRLPSIGGYSAQVAKKDAAGVWRSLFPAPASRPVAAPATGTAKIWLNGLRRPHLDRSVAQVGAPAAWGRGFTGRGVKVAVIDTGIDTTHPELKGQVVAARTFVDEPAGDQVGHGTHVASTIAGTGATYRGVAPDAKLIDAKVCSAEDCPEDALLAAMEWAATEQRAAVINLSLGGPDGPGIDPVEQAVNRLSASTGTLFVVSAGNRGGAGPGSVTSPGSAQAALTVGAVDHEDNLAGFSGRGPLPGDGGVKPDLTAPGVEIAAARAAGTQLGESVGEHHVRASGTSMAAPHAAGAAALLRQQQPDWSGAEVKAALMASAEPGADPAFGSGAGRLAVDVAVDQRVTSAPDSVGFGLAKFPHEDDEVRSRTITYRNTGDQPVELDLELRVAGETPHPFALSRSHLSVPARGTADVVLTADTRPTSIPNGLSSGRLIASGAGVRVSTPFGIEKEEERYDLALSHLGRDGGDPDGFVTYLNRLGECSRTIPCLTIVGGSGSDPAAARLIPGDYSVGSFVQSADQSWTMLVDHVVRVTADSSRIMDARAAGPVEVSVPRATAELVEGYAVVGANLRTPYDDAATYVNPIGPPGRPNFVGDGGRPATSPNEVVSMVRAVFAEPGPAGTFEDSPYSYTIQKFEAGKVINGFRARPRAGDFAQVHMTYASDVPSDGPDRRVDLGSFATPLTPLPFELLLGPGGQTVESTTVPFRRTEFVLASDVQWSHGTVQRVPSSQDGRAGQWTLNPARYQPGQVTRMRWNEGVLSPQLAPIEINKYFDTVTHGAARNGDTLEIALSLRVDSHPNHRGHPRLPYGSYRMYREGELVTEEDTSNLTVPVPAAEAEYRLESRVSDLSTAVSTRIDTTWTFRSGRVEERTALPLMVLRFTPSLDDRNRAPAGSFAVPITVQRQPGAAAASMGKPVVDYSSDQGKTWQAAKVVRTAAGWNALVVNQSGATVSLRGVAADSAGSKVEQLIQDAYLVK